MNRLITLALAAFLGVTALGPTPGLAFAQGGPSGRHPGHSSKPEMTKEQRDDAMEKIKALRVYQLTEILELEGEQSQAFFALLSAYDDKSAGFHRERREAHRALRRAVGAEQKGEVISPETFSKLVSDMYARAAEAEAAQAAFIEEAEKILSPSQLARFVLYQKEFERRLRHEIMRIGRGGPEQEGSLKCLKDPKDLVQ